MQKIILVVVFFLLSGISLAKDTVSPQKNISQTAAALNKQVKSQHGVGLQSLSLLFEVGPSRFFPKQILERNGSWKSYKELESAGYIKLTVSNGLPDGSATTTQFVTVALTAKGSELRSALFSHN